MFPLAKIRTITQGTATGYHRDNISMPMTDNGLVLATLGGATKNRNDAISVGSVREPPVPGIERSSKEKSD